MIKATRKYVLDTQLFINAFRDPGANHLLQRFHRAFAPFEHLSLVVAQELRADLYSLCQCLEPFRRRVV